MGYQVVSSVENDTADGLVSEVLGLPLLLRGESSVRLWNPVSHGFRPVWNGKTLSDLIGLPTVFKADRPRARLMKGTISEKIGLPTLLK